MAEAGVLKLTKRFEEGFTKDSVREYVDGLLSTIRELEKNAEESSMAINSDDFHKLEVEIKELKGKLDASNIQIQKQEALLSGEKNVREKLQKQFAEEKQRLSAELAAAKSSSGESEMYIEQLRERNEEIEHLVEKIHVLEDAAVKNEDIISAKDEKIAKLQAEIKELKENPGSGQNMFDFQSAFIEAQNVVNKYAADAKKSADVIIDEANQKSEKIISDANEYAARTVHEANERAEKAISEAEAEAVRKLESTTQKTAAFEQMSESLKKMFSDDILKTSELLNDVRKNIDEAVAKLNKTSVSIIDNSAADEMIKKFKEENNIIESENNVLRNKTDVSEPIETVPVNNNIVAEPVTVNNNMAEPVPVNNNISETVPVNEPIVQENNYMKPERKSKKHYERKEPAPVKKPMISPQDWGIDLDALTKEIEEEESRKQEIEAE